MNGWAAAHQLRTNAGALSGDILFLTKPLGTGLYSTAFKKSAITDHEMLPATEAMTRLNDIGHLLADLPGVHALTDVTGFGLAGHLGEMAAASGLQAHFRLEKLPLLPLTIDLATAGHLAGGNKRNQIAVADTLHFTGTEVAVGPRHTNVPADIARAILCDPQTSGGLLIAVAPDVAAEVRELLRSRGWYADAIGVFSAGEPGQIVGE